MFIFEFVLILLFIF